MITMTSLGLARHTLQRAIRPTLTHAPFASRTTPALNTLRSYTRSQNRLPSNTILNVVPQQEAWIVERLGKFNTILPPGLAILIPFIDRISYVHSLKELALEIPAQSAITQDNVTLTLDGVLYLRVTDAYKASYGVSDPEYAVTQLAQTTMRSEIGKLALDTIFRERNNLNESIVIAINQASADWGIACLRYEIRDIQLPEKVVEAMQMQVAAERKKRASILESEGARDSAINRAEGQRKAVILSSEAEMSNLINLAKGEADSIRFKAEATAASIKKIAEATNINGGSAAMQLSVAQQYVSAFAEVAKESTTLLLPANVSDPSSMIAQALSIYKNVGNAQGTSVPAGSATPPATKQ
eukprot:CFRG2724T1